MCFFAQRWLLLQHIIAFVPPDIAANRTLKTKSCGRQVGVGLDKLKGTHRASGRVASSRGADLTAAACDGDAERRLLIASWRRARAMRQRLTHQTHPLY